MGKTRQPVCAQQGMATLAIILVLMMCATMLTLAVANTRRTEQLINANDIWNTRLGLAAEAGIARAVARLASGNLAWLDERTLRRQTSADVSAPGSQNIEIRTRLYRPAYHSGPVRIETEAIRDDGSGQAVRISEYVQPLSALTPAAEQAPPLVINGCISSAGGILDILPAPTSAGTTPATAVRSSETAGCTPPGWADMHSGRYTSAPLGPDLWPDIFSVSRQQFELLVLTDQQLNDPERLYLIAAATDLVSGRWTRSLGSPAHPVILYIPPVLGCPEFSPGVRIYGVVFIDNSCTSSGNPFALELFGMLAINGDISAGSINLRLRHLQTVDPQLKTLSYPTLRVIPIPGTWSDF